VDLIVAGPDFQRNFEPASTTPSREADLTAGFQLGQRSIVVRTFHTISGGAAISISDRPTTGACSLISDREVISSEEPLAEHAA
jgi:hypothetical protein